MSERATKPKPGCLNCADAVCDECETPEQRSVRLGLPHSVWSGSFRIFGVEVKCHTLSDGQRIIEADSMRNLLEAMGAPGVTIDGQLEEFAKWQTG